MSESGGRSLTIDPVDHEPPSAGPTTRGRWRWRRWLIAVATAFALVAGAITAGAVSYWSSVDLPSMVTLPATTTLYYADGETVLARLSDADRTELAYEEILPTVVDVTLAAEDPEFWSNAAGPITRAAVRHAFELQGSGANTRVRTWVLAHKLEAAYSKEYILAWYLNAVPFGRMAYGIEAAARAYFGKSASSSADPAQQLTTAEAMVLLALVDQPYPDTADPWAYPGFDPGSSPGAEANSRRRWAEIRDALTEFVGAGPTRSGLTAGAVSALSYPMPQPGTGSLSGLDRPVGLVAGHILSELTRTPGSHFEGWSWDAVRYGGFEITTTIDARAQQALEAAADDTVAGSLMSGQPENLQAAGVVIEPGTGRVLAYYGGHDGTGMDYAGVYRDEAGELVGYGAHPPGGSFMIYPLAAALKAGYSLDSQWQWTPHEQTGRAPGNWVRNTARCASNPDGSACSLLDSVVYGLNVPLYDVTLSVGLPAVLAMARDAGITALWDDMRERVSLSDLDAVLAVVGPTLGLGQYPVTVLDQAGAMATFAGGGGPAPVHFVREVTMGDELFYGETLPAAGGEPVLSAGQLADLTHALTSASGQDDLAIKTGVWEYGGGAGENAHAWSVGFSSAVAVAVWIGNRGEEQPLYDQDGTAVWGSGLPTQILRQVVAETQAGLNVSPQPFPPAVFGGDVHPPGSLPPAG